MNYLKEIKKVKEMYSSENEYIEKKLAACRIVEFVAQTMYDAELDRTQYCIWEAIIDLLNAVKYRY